MVRCIKSKRDGKLQNVKKYYPFLHVLSECKSMKQRKGLIEHCPSGLINTISECCANSLRGNIPHTVNDKQKLKRHKRSIYALIDKKNSIPFKRARIIQSGGFLGLLLKPLLAGLTGLLGGLGGLGG